MPYILLGLICVCVLGIVFIYARWEEQDDRRRSDRLVHRNLQRMSGR